MDPAQKDSTSPHGALPEGHPFLTVGRKGLSATTNDLIAVGILILALCAGLAALMVALGWVAEKIDGNLASRTILGCVGGSIISGAISALLGKRKP